MITFRLIVAAAMAFTSLAFLLAPLPAAAQAQLYAGLIKSKGYVVGAPLSASGLHRFDGDTTWTHIGWNIPRISGIAARPEDDATLFLAAGNGVLRTLDGGDSWRLVTDWEVTESQDVAVDPSAPDEVYVGSAFGVWRSADGGWTWTEANEGIATTYTWTIAVDRVRPRRLLAGTWGGVYESTDGAVSWSLVSANCMAIRDLEQSRTDPQFWAAATREHGVLFSRDGGRFWTEAGGAVDGLSIMSVSIDPTDHSRIAAAGWDTGVLVSTDAGATWSLRGENLPVPDFYQVLFDPMVPGRLWSATVEAGVFRSDDVGETWQYVGLSGTLVFGLAFLNWRAE